VRDLPPSCGGKIKNLEGISREERDTLTQIKYSGERGKGQGKRGLGGRLPSYFDQWPLIYQGRMK